MQTLELKPERRVAERIELKRLAKVMHHPSHRYLPASTRNISTTGALIEVVTTRPLAAGDNLDVFVDFDDTKVLDNSNAVSATIIRVQEWTDERQTIAIHFQDAIELKEAA